jgi:RNA polymerase sigma-70 factor (ECF subfamily)
MTNGTLTRARAGDEQAFRELTEPYRRELQFHCYRILGSVQDAEDMLQETFLAAWRGLEQYQGRASMRAWLYRIATNRCLNALRDSGRRPRELPPPRVLTPEPTRVGEPVWLEPYPDVLLEGVPDVAPGPDALYECKEAMTLAFVTALQVLPPRQRAVLLLRDVLGYQASEVAEMVDGSEASVNSALQRARSTLEHRLGPERERAPGPRSAVERALVGRFAEAFETDDVDGIVRLLTDDATLAMPPEPLEYHGAAAARSFFSDWVFARNRGRFRLVATRANGQPTFGYYLRDPHAPIARAGGLLVLTLEGERIGRITRFGDTSVFPYFGLPRVVRE